MRVSRRYIHVRIGRSLFEIPHLLPAGRSDMAVMALGFILQMGALRGWEWLPLERTIKTKTAA